MSASFLVSGASGQLGRRVVELLLEANAGPIVATTRTPEKLADLAARGVEVRRADFDEPSTLAPAFAGVRRALLVSTDALDRPGRRLAQHRAAIAAFEASGVEHVVYTSLPNPNGSPVTIANDHAETEATLASTKLDFTILRNNLYADYLLASLGQALGSGQLVDAKGESKVAWVTREDCARAAAGALLDGARGRRILDVTGPEALSSDELAAIVSGVTGRTIVHVSVSDEVLVKGMVEHGLPEPIARLMTSFDHATRDGLLVNVSDTVERLSQRPPKRVSELIREQLAR
jgi:NAD(P)H dehydrogenase (quinone)